MKQSPLRAYLPVIGFVFAAIFVLVKIDSVLDFLGRLFHLLTPLWLAVIFYYIFARAVRFFTRHFSKVNWLSKGKRAVALSVFVTYSVFIGLVSLIILLIIPSLQQNLTEFFINFQLYVKSLNRLTDNFTSYLAEKNIDPVFINNLQTKLSQLGSTITTYGLDFARGFISDTVSTVGNFLIALILSIYLVAGEDRFRSNIKRVISAASGEKRERVLHIFALADDIFHAYFFVQLTEALLLGGFCFFLFSILKIPYAVIISVLIALLAMIPVVGAWIAAIAGTIILVLVDPKKILLFLVSYLITQQIEGNVIYPRRVGNRTGLPGLIVILAVLVGGGIGGVGGALVSVPIASVLFQLLREWTLEQEEKNSTSITASENAAVAALTESKESSAVDPQADLQALGRKTKSFLSLFKGKKKHLDK